MKVKSSKRRSAAWQDSDVRALLNFLLEHKAEAGDGANFKPAIWNKAATMFSSIPHNIGGPKTANSCKNKWAKLQKTFHVVKGLMAQSGFSWNPEHGADVSLGQLSAWKDYIKQHRGANSFRSKGWSYWDDMVLLMPSAEKGTHAFRGTLAAARPTAHPAAPPAAPPATHPAANSLSGPSTNPSPGDLPPLSESSIQHLLNTLQQSSPGAVNAFPNTPGSSTSSSSTPATPPTPIFGTGLPPPSSSLPAYISGASSLGKRKHSALGTPGSNSMLGSTDYGNQSSPGASQAGKSRQSRRPNNAVQLSTKLDEVNIHLRVKMLLDEVKAQAALQSNKNARINQAKQLALQRDKDWLGYEKLAVLWDVLNSIRETDSYMMIEDEAFRKVWVKRKLIQSGWPESDWE